ncbi:MAG: ABC transporter ATP-binding protein [Nitrospiraceae bacterium]|nr:ABC transporter ATP-binding protein [Nitrospiraceae bacterium]
MKTAIATNNLTKIYTEGKNEVTAVSGVSLALKEGEVVGLLGPSGSGKTTLLSMLGCILRPTSGTLSVYDNRVEHLDEQDLPVIRKKYLSFIFQGFNLFPALTAYENVMLALSLKGFSENDASVRATNLLTEVGLSERMHFLPRDLSGGQKQRVAVARALASGSQVILADEPTGNLDHINGRKVMELLKKLSVEQSKCVIVATHDNRINDLFDRILYMQDGTIIKEDRRQE